MLRWNPKFVFLDTPNVRVLFTNSVSIQQMLPARLSQILIKFSQNVH